MPKRNKASSLGDILLFFDPRGMGALISALTKSRYYHVALCTGAGELVEAMTNAVVRSTIAARH